MRHVVLLLVLLGLVQAPTAPLEGQSSTWPDPGDRVRITTDSILGEYQVASLEPESLLLRADPGSEQFEIPTASLYRLEVLRGRNSRLRGSIVGGLLGGVLAGWIALPCDVQPHVACGGSSPVAQAALIGFGVGAAIGAFWWGGREDWQEVRLPGRLAAGSRPDGPASRTSRDIITREDIERLPSPNAYVIVEQLRPAWLRSRTPGTPSTFDAVSDIPGADAAIYPEVFQDDLPYGPIESLIDFPPEVIERIEYFAPSDATTLYGTGYIEGIIRVVTRR